MIFAQWRARRASKALIDRAILGEIVAAARRRALYEALGAPDRFDGQFELLALHAGLVLRRLAALGGLANSIAQDLVNSLFTHFDDTLREMALSDIAVSKRLKSMGSAFYGRNAAYAAALEPARARNWPRRWRAMCTGLQTRRPRRRRPSSPSTSDRSTLRYRRRQSRRSQRAGSVFPRDRSRPEVL